MQGSIVVVNIGSVGSAERFIQGLKCSRWICFRGHSTLSAVCCSWEHSDLKPHLPKSKAHPLLEGFLFVIRCFSKHNNSIKYLVLVWISYFHGGYWNYLTKYDVMRCGTDDSRDLAGRYQTNTNYLVIDNNYNNCDVISMGIQFSKLSDLSFKKGLLYTFEV